MRRIGAASRLLVAYILGCAVLGIVAEDVKQDSELSEWEQHFFKRSDENLKRYVQDPTKDCNEYGCTLKDTDGDGLNDWEEINKYGTDPLKADTDGDGLKDGEEINVYRTNPLSQDTDGDGLSDFDEVTKHFTNPIAPDTDGDGLSDYDEIMKYKTVNK
uniref:Calcium-binding protein n=1 Tax=Pyramimonas obovata TaxID=1411642 RepID=A0A7S0RGB8_9CHLO|mmetsp:Transcript_33659/g.73483  ORF Transcript_33659/g.73483 Transcript_33659/m.73483 type:complete len:159 (+) Transcript_33659:149-625(+)|eukprot:CAMPEP_0118956994 /NCGR_PEP_ID=MMETSP1169-20130426/61870_1 /TAXON_ID=36882 /ORGANISM="Pyramimonas obovata, Strain CCMP722" /LENGTH=158 /DNA_ID=CAMNT_0006905047 /DNA_START=1068 /DNA_END=1544 /DNA_ORIENTATION=-